MNIALFTDTYPPYINGVSTSCYNLVQVLRSHGHRVIVVTTRYDDGQLIVKDDIVQMPGLKSEKFYGYKLTKIYDRKVVKILRDAKVQIIHNQTDVSVGFFARRAAKALRVPIVYTYHTSYEDYTHIFSHGVFDRVFKSIMRTYSREISKHSTEFITPSIKTKDYVRNNGHDVYVNVLPSGIDFSIFDDSKVDHERTKQFKIDHKVDDDTKIMLLLGRTATEKSMDVSIKFFTQYHNLHPEKKLKLFIVGDGPQRGELELLVHELHMANYIEFLGKCNANEVPFYYHLADIYTSASITETQGLTFMESMAAGTIVLARYDDNLADTINDGQTGFFFTDASSFNTKLDFIFSLTKEQADEIRTKARNALDDYTIDRFYNNVMEVYIRAIKKCW